MWARGVNWELLASYTSYLQFLITLTMIILKFGLHFDLNYTLVNFHDCMFYSCDTIAMTIICVRTDTNTWHYTQNRFSVSLSPGIHLMGHHVKKLPADEVAAGCQQKHFLEGTWGLKWNINNMYSHSRICMCLTHMHTGRNFWCYIQIPRGLN